MHRNAALCGNGLNLANFDKDVNSILTSKVSKVLKSGFKEGYLSKISFHYNYVMHVHLHRNEAFSVKRRINEIPKGIDQA